MAGLGFANRTKAYLLYVGRFYSYHLCLSILLHSDSDVCWRGTDWKDLLQAFGLSVCLYGLANVPDSEGTVCAGFESINGL
jgi:hypothetical protein